MISTGGAGRRRRRSLGSLIALYERERPVLVSYDGAGPDDSLAGGQAILRVIAVPISQASRRARQVLGVAGARRSTRTGGPLCGYGSDREWLERPQYDLEAPWTRPVCRIS
jgi:hypothetical protein